MSLNPLRSPIKLLRHIVGGLRGVFRKEREDRELDEELRDYLDAAANVKMRAGVPRDEAVRAARMEMGSLESVKEEVRAVGWESAVQTVWQDVRFALRMLTKSPGFAVVTILTLALAIGANTAIFSAVYAVLLKPLPFKDADRLAFIEKKNPPRGWDRNTISPAEILAWRDQSRAFEDMAAYTQRHCVLTGAAEAEEDPCEVISSNLFPILGVAPIRGRTFSADEDKPEGPRVAILSYALWQRRFAADENVIGRSVDIDGASYTIVGIMPPSFSHAYAPPYHALSESFAQLWLSGIALSPASAWNDYFGIGWLKSGLSLQQAEAPMDTVSARIEAMYRDLK